MNTPRPIFDQWSVESLQPVVVPRLQAHTRVAIWGVLIAATVYGSFILRPSNAGESLAYAGLATAEILLLLHTLSIWWTSLAADPRILEGTVRLFV